MDDDPLDFWTGLCLGIILLMVLIVVCWLFGVFKVEQRIPPNDTRSALLYESALKKVKTEVPLLPEAQPRMVKIWTADGWIEEEWLN